MQPSTFDSLTSLNKAISHRFWDLISLRWPMIVSKVLSRISIHDMQTRSKTHFVKSTISRSISFAAWAILSWLISPSPATFFTMTIMILPTRSCKTWTLSSTITTPWKAIHIFKIEKDRNIHTSHACRTFRATWMASWTKGTGINFAADCKTLRISRPYSKGEGVTFVCQNLSLISWGKVKYKSRTIISSASAGLLPETQPFRRGQKEKQPGAMRCKLTRLAIWTSLHCNGAHCSSQFADEYRKRSTLTAVNLLNVMGFSRCRALSYFLNIMIVSVFTINELDAPKFARILTTLPGTSRIFCEDYASSNHQESADYSCSIDKTQENPFPHSI